MSDMAGGGGVGVGWGGKILERKRHMVHCFQINKTFQPQYGLPQLYKAEHEGNHVLFCANNEGGARFIWYAHPFGVVAKFTDEQYTTINQPSSSTAYKLTCKQLTKTLGSKHPAVDWLIVVSVNFATISTQLWASTASFWSVAACTYLLFLYLHFW